MLYVYDTKLLHKEMRGAENLPCLGPGIGTVSFILVDVVEITFDDVRSNLDYRSGSEEESLNILTL